MRCMMIIMGIDPGTAITGYGLINKENNRLTLLEYGVIRTEKDIPANLRLLEVFEGINELIDRFKPEHIAIEELFFNKNTKTALSVGQSRGVIILAAELKGVRTFEYTPLQVKQAVVGYGRADKKQVQFMVKAIMDMKEIAKPDDAADALAISICHANYFRFDR